MDKACDLHAHSLYSDGTCTPAELILLAEEKGLSHLALTDHNTVLGLREFLQAAETSLVEAVPGIEISCGFQGKEVHILGLYLPPTSFDEVHTFVQEIHRRKDESNRQLVQRLRDAGYDLCYETLVANTRGGHINRAHIAKAMLEKGDVPSVEAAVKGVLSPAYGLYQPPERLDALEAVRRLAAWGAVPVLAHPFLNQTESELHIFLPQARASGLIGMETRYPLYDEPTARLAAQMARQYGLLESGGSDFHGAIKPHIALGTGTGSLFVPAAFAENLKQKSALP